jgi:glucokinase
MDLKIGVDIGGTEIKAGIIDRKGKVLKKVVVLTESGKGKDVVIENIIKAISLVLKYKKFRKTPPIGVGVPGPLDRKKGILGDSPNVPLKGTNLKKILKKRVKATKIEIENDSNCYALGEALYGAGKGCKSVLGLTLGTGIGGGVVINKELYIGQGNAGEFGHMTIKFNGMIASCGNDGCIEEYISKRGIIRLAESFGMRNLNDPMEIHKLAIKKDPSANHLFKEVGVYLGIAVSNLANAFNPDKIIIGGGVSNAWNFFSGSLKEEVKKRSISKTVVVRGKLGGNSGLIGAASLV